MALTFRELRELVAPYVGEAGSCWDSPNTASFAKLVMEMLLYEGSTGAVKQFSFCAERGYLTLPKEVATPIKVRVDHSLAEVWGKWFAFNSVDGDFESAGNPCYDARAVLKSVGYQSPLIYSLPANGALVGIHATCEEDCNSYVIIHGIDVHGKEVYTVHGKDRIVGEKITLEKDKIKYGRVVYKEITGVIKPPTKGYVSCYAVHPISKQQKYLADWSPSETRPMYSKYVLSVPSIAQDIVSVSMLARVKLKDTYADNELTLFDNRLAIMFAAQKLQAEINNNDAGAQYKGSIVADVLEKEAGYKKVSGNPVNVYYPLSGGVIKGIV